MSYSQGWNDALTTAVNLLRDNADRCSPESAAAKQNWPFVLETMARELEKRRDAAQGSHKEKP